MMATQNELELLTAVARMNEQIIGLRDDVARINAKLDESISVGANHRAELDRRLTKLEAETPRYVTYRQLVMWATGGAVGAGGLVTALHQVIGAF